MRIGLLANKRVAIYGFGREGRAVFEAVRKQLPAQAITVLSDAPLAAAEREFLASQTAVEVHDSPDAGQRLSEFEIVIKSPGVSPYRPDFEAARQRGVEFTSATRIWFAEHPGAATIVVTGTKGKSTTASLIAHLLQQAGKRVALGGNIGLPLLQLADDPPPDWWVIELSSYQISDFDGAPTIRLLLNLYPEHTDWHGDTETYFRDKLRLLTAPEPGLRIINFTDNNSRERLAGLENPLYFNAPDGLHVSGDWICEGARRIMPTTTCRLPGAHNLSNLCAALAVVRAAGLDPLDCAAAVASFQALPHRLSNLGESGGLEFIDDSISTTPQSAEAALAAFAGQRVTMLLGGYERHLDWREAADFIAQHAHAVVTMGSNGGRIAQAIREAIAARGLTTPPRLIETADLPAAVAAAIETTPPGGVVLLSPGSPSYGEFNNFQERGAAFARAAGLVG